MAWRRARIHDREPGRFRHRAQKIAGPAAHSKNHRPDGDGGTGKGALMTNYIDVALEVLDEIRAKCFPVQANKIPYPGYKWTDPGSCFSDRADLRRLIDE